MILTSEEIRCLPKGRFCQNLANFWGQLCPQSIAKKTHPPAAATAPLPSCAPTDPTTTNITVLKTTRALGAGLGARLCV